MAGPIGPGRLCCGPTLRRPSCRAPTSVALRGRNLARATCRRRCPEPAAGACSVRPEGSTLGCARQRPSRRWGCRTSGSADRQQPRSRSGRRTRRVASGDRTGVATGVPNNGTGPCAGRPGCCRSWQATHLRSGRTRRQLQGRCTCRRGPAPARDAWLARRCPSGHGCRACDVADVVPGATGVEDVQVAGRAVHPHVTGVPAW